MGFKMVSKNTNTNKYVRTADFLKTTVGAHVIRLLNVEDAVIKETHWINGATVQCLGDDCPQCELNKKIIYENPESFRNVAAFSPKVLKYVVNVLDRTPAKICPSCGTATKVYFGEAPSTCSTCGAMIASVEVAPLNEVKVLMKGRMLFEKFNVLERSVLDENGEPLGLKNFDILLNVVDTSGKNTFPVPAGGRDKVEVPDSELFDLERVIPRLSPDNMRKLMSGVQLRDIFAEEKTSIVKNQPSEHGHLSEEDIQEKIRQLYAE